MASRAAKSNVQRGTQNGLEGGLGLSSRTLAGEGPRWCGGEGKAWLIEARETDGGLNKPSPSLGSCHRRTGRDGV